MFKFFLFTSLFVTAQIMASTQALHQLVFTIRDPQTQSTDFRNSLEKIGEYLANEILEDLAKKEITVKTLTNVDATHSLVNETPVLVAILRAALPLHAGVQKVFPLAETGFLAMSRNEETLIAQCDYVALPDVKDKVVIVIDTMLATGGSMTDAIRLIEQFHPKQIFIISAIAADSGIQRVLKEFPSVKIFSAVTDPYLNEKGYILPGLGDAGDRCYGIKAITTNSVIK